MSEHNILQLSKFMQLITITGVVVFVDLVIIRILRAYDEDSDILEEIKTQSYLTSFLFALYFSGCLIGYYFLLGSDQFYFFITSAAQLNLSLISSSQWLTLASNVIVIGGSLLVRSWSRVVERRGICLLIIGCLLSTISGLLTLRSVQPVYRSMLQKNFGISTLR